jgi:hypothetical protein
LFKMLTENLGGGNILVYCDVLSPSLIWNLKIFYGKMLGKANLFEKSNGPCKIGRLLCINLFSVTIMKYLRLGKL